MLVHLLPFSKLNLNVVSHEQRTNGARAPSRSVHILCLLAVAAIASACGGGNASDGIACTTEARTSMVLTVVDQFGAPLPGVTAMYRANAGNAQSEACDSNGKCTIAFEVGGVFAITAAKVGHTSTSATVTVTRDACHVITERLTLTLLRAA